MKIRKHTTPLLSALAASMLCANFAATVSAHGIYEKYHTDRWGQPVIAVLIEGLSHEGSSCRPAEQLAGNDSALLSTSQSNTVEIPDVLAGQPKPAVSGSVSGGAPDSGASGQQIANDPKGSGKEQHPETTGSGNSSGDPGAQQSTELTGSGNRADNDRNGQTNAGAAAPGGPDAESARESGSAAQSGPDSPAPSEPRQYAFTEVPQDYFDDALFIGDSRVTGVALYSGWDNLTYYAEGGMTVYSMFQSRTAQVDGQTLTIEEALQKRSFGKIYLEIGINEMGTGTVDSFLETYEAAVARLRELQPDAILYVCGIMYVEQSKSQSDPIFNNPAIQERNDGIAALADGEHIFYLDINEVVTDETGNLNPEYTWDEVHLLGKYDVIWLEYFSSHGIVKDA